MKIHFPTIRHTGFNRAADIIDAYYDRGVWNVPTPANDEPDDMPPPAAPAVPVQERLVA